MAAKDARLAEILGHRFQDGRLLSAALTHPSLETAESYQRLEFLGDRVLGLVISDMLYARYRAAPEGELASRLNALVRKETLADIALATGIRPHIRLSKSEEDTGGRDKAAILADVTEALIGALYLDAGLEAAKAFILRHWEPYIDGQKAAPKDPKTALQEWAQGRGYPVPAYKEINREGPPHAPVFTMRVSAGPDMAAEAQGASKQSAEQAAARKLLAHAQGQSEKEQS